MKKQFKIDQVKEVRKVEVKAQVKLVDAVGYGTWETMAGVKEAAKEIFAAAMPNEDPRMWELEHDRPESNAVDGMIQVRLIFRRV